MRGYLLIFDLLTWYLESSLDVRLVICVLKLDWCCVRSKWGVQLWSRSLEFTLWLANISSLSYITCQRIVEWELFVMFVVFTQSIHEWHAMQRLTSAIMTSIPKKIAIPRKGVDYRGKVVLWVLWLGEWQSGKELTLRRSAPMVRSGELPSRLLALHYGADLVWGMSSLGSIS